VAAMASVGPRQRIVGIYHTHHGSARMSALDRQNIKLYPLLWVVVGVSQGPAGPIYDWKGFRNIRGGRVREVAVSILTTELAQA
jgi:proteasome lid subunit RPN8/RPN11